MPATDHLKPSETVSDLTSEDESYLLDKIVFGLFTQNQNFMLLYMNSTKDIQNGWSKPKPFGKRSHICNSSYHLARDYHKNRTKSLSKLKIFKSLDDMYQILHSQTKQLNCVKMKGIPVTDPGVYLWGFPGVL